MGKLAAEIVPGSLKIWDGTKKKTTTTTNSDGTQVACEPADYHGNVTAPLFEQWFTDLCGVPKSTVLDLAQQLKQSATRQFVIYSICREFGHTAKLTPPYHPELQPIERVWCAVKNPIANNPCGTMTELQAALRTNFRDLESDDDSSSEEEEDETVPPTQQQDMETMATQDF